MSDKFYNPYTDRLVSKNGPTYRKICKRLAKEEFESLVASKKTDKPRLVKREAVQASKPKMVPKQTARVEYKTVRPTRKAACSSSESSVDEDTSDDEPGTSNNTGADSSESDDDLQFIIS